MSENVEARPAPGEWIEWSGGECPLEHPTLHQVRYRDGLVSPVKGRFEGSFDAAIWRHDPAMRQFDIIAYRQVQP